jgi:hypothetical protein
MAETDADRFRQEAEECRKLAERAISQHGRRKIRVLVFFWPSIGALINHPNTMITPGGGDLVADCAEGRRPGAAIEFFLKTEMDERLIAAYDVASMFSAMLPISMISADRNTTGTYETISMFSN